MSQKGIALSELCKKIFRALDDKFAFERIWVRAEINSCNSSRGHYYLQLIEENQGQLEAKISANLWASTFKRLERKIGEDLPELLEEGTKVLLQVRVEFHSVYGLKLNIDDIDPTYTYGELAMRKQQTIAKLKKAGLHEKNNALDFPAVAQRIALVASSSSAGYADFVDQLAKNSYGYEFALELFETGVQGSRAEVELIEAFQKIDRKKFDLVVLIRGGGSKLDLDVFNGYDLCAEIANCPVPVITGIGHQTDWLVADLVAARALKTPTATADFLIEQMVEFETEIIETHDKVIESILLILQEKRQELTVASRDFANESVNRVQAESKLLLRTAFALTSSSKKLLEKNRLLNSESRQRLRSSVEFDIDLFTESAKDRLSRSVQNVLNGFSKDLEQNKKAISYLSPQNVLKRGYSITTFEGRTISDQNLPDEGDLIVTKSRFHRLESVLRKIEKDED